MQTMWYSSHSHSLLPLLLVSQNKKVEEYEKESPEQTLGKQSANHFRLERVPLMPPPSWLAFRIPDQRHKTQEGVEGRREGCRRHEGRRGRKSSLVVCLDATKWTVREMISDPRAAHDTRSRLYVSQQSGNNGNSIQSGLEGMKRPGHSLTRNSLRRKGTLSILFLNTCARQRQETESEWVTGHHVSVCVWVWQPVSASPSAATRTSEQPLLSCLLLFSTFPFC